MTFHSPRFFFLLLSMVPVSQLAGCISAPRDGDDLAPSSSGLHGRIRVECVNRQYQSVFRFDADSTASPDTAAYSIPSALGLTIPWRSLSRGALLAADEVTVRLDTVIADTVYAQVESTGSAGALGRVLVLWKDPSLPGCPHPPVLFDEEPEEWVRRTPAIVQDLAAVVWNGERLIVVGAAGSIQTSSDGMAWSAENSGTSQALNSLAWSGDHWTGATGRLVAVGTGGVILGSIGGRSWTLESSGTAQRLAKVIWTGTGDGSASGRFVAVGDSGIILVSSDGTLWTQSDSKTKRNLRDVVSDENMIVAVGDYGIILSSPDGAVWTVRREDTLASSRLDFVERIGSSYFRAYNLGSPPFSGGYSYESVAGVDWEYSISGFIGRTYAVGAQFLTLAQELTDVPMAASVFVHPILSGTAMKTLGTTNRMTGLAWTGSRLVAVGHGGTILTLP